MYQRTTPAQKFKALLDSGETLVVPGAHDPITARIVESLGFKACICAGWMTGAQTATPEPVMSMTEQVEAARRVAEKVGIPVTSDAGTGFGEPIHVMRTVTEFARAGIARIQIEDQFFPKRASYHRGVEHVVPLDEFKRRIEFALKAREREGYDILISARTDAGNAVNGSWEEAGRRARAMKELGVDSINAMTRTKDAMERFRQAYPDSDVPLATTSYFNGMPVDEIRAYGFQIITYPLASIVASLSGVFDLWRDFGTAGQVRFDADKARAVREAVEDLIGLPDMWQIEKETVEYDTAQSAARQVAGYEGADQRAN